MNRSPFALLPLLLCLGAPFAAPAVAQDAVSALRGHNSNAPVDVAADRIELQDRADRAILSGNVQVRQADLTMTAQRLTVAYSRAGGTQIQRLDASGGVTVRSPSETARGNFAIYDLNRRLITMIGNVVLTRGPQEVRGGRLVINLTTGRATVDGSTVGAGGTSSSGGRVTGRFTVPQRN
ncbi:OstA family protein [Sphingomonas oleivorans]|uniref:OstA family protein n=1 Tax=Sphingomonas oleivorans TaxID=1735121 RepID=A0A2T5FX97_9SPHN|nr:LptA/OstA family protein [Sphingomonas oleivorans]PTQ10738.1 OstA family protein [Sphingomonas oleivorans]